jgi:ssDNA-binding Zn-finger/Zn-ribbon topoisomerase 1
MGIIADFREVIRGLRHKRIDEETIKLCPKCGSNQIVMTSGLNTYPRLFGITPEKHLCSECGYCGTIILEQTKEKTD